MNLLYIIPAIIVAIYLADIVRLNHKLNQNLTRESHHQHKTDIYLDVCIIILTLVIFATLLTF